MITLFLLFPVSVLAVTSFDGDSSNEFFGYEIDELGDVSGDTVPDFVVGAPYDSTIATEAGSAYVISGADGSRLRTFTGDSASDWFGRSVNAAGDVNNDGTMDVIVGAYGDDNNGAESGSATVYSGADGTVLYTFNGTAAGDNFGFSVSGAGDVNNDNYDDVIVGAYLADTNGTDSGSAIVYSGIDGSVLYTFNGDADDRLGWSVSDAGDINKDNYDDVLLGVYYDDNGASTDVGAVWVMSGIDGSVLFTRYGDAPYDYLGQAVATAGDVNNDTYPDFVAGARKNDVNGSEAGMARIYSGQDGSTLYTFYGDAAGDRFGNYVDTAGDVDGDNYDDVIVGAYWDDNSGTSSGSARIFSGVDGSVVTTLGGNKSYDLFGNSVSGAGDVNNDGLADVLVGAHGVDLGGTDSGSFFLYLSANKGVDNDINNNGVADVVIRNSSTGAWKIYNFDTAMNAGPVKNTNLTTDLVRQFVAFGDYDADGDVDVLTRNSSDGKWHVRVMSGNDRQSGGVVNISLYTNADWQFAGTYDADADGDDDVLLRRTSDGVWRLFIVEDNAVSSSSVPSVIFSNQAWEFRQAGDFDGDGDGDVITRRNSDGKWRVTYSQAGDFLSTATMNSMWTSSDVVLQSVGDMDQDSDADVLLRKTSNGKWLVQEFDAGIAKSGGVTTANMYTSSSWEFRSLSDLDGDGDADVLMRRNTDGIWRTFELQSRVYTGTTSPVSIYSASSWLLRSNR
jgi:hypothetical protein